jgi:predicted CoA-binding protein
MDIDDLVRDFLAQKSVAVVGVSDRRETGCNMAYKRFKDAGYTVWPINPRLTEFDGSPCYPNLGAIPEKPDAVFILTKPEITEQIVLECIDLGIGHVWMHCMLGIKPGLVAGMTSVSQDAVALGREHGIKVIPGSCPNQFLNPDFPHRMIRGVSRMLGFLRSS